MRETDRGVAPGRLVAPQAFAAAPLLERERERSALLALIARARGGHGGAIVIEGAAGIGKTRLLHEVAAGAMAEQLAPLVARGSELERDFAFGGVRQLFERHLARLPERARRSALAGAAAQAAPIFYPSPAPARGGDPHPILHGLYWLAANLSTREPLLLSVDDAHWLDEPSLRWLAYLANRLAELPIAVVIAMRPREPGAVQALLDRIAAHPDTAVMTPRPLSRHSVRRLAEESIGGEPEPPFVAACMDATGGNPFFVAELLRALAAEGVAATGTEAPRVLELAAPTVGRAVMRRLSGLSPEAIRVARAVAVLGSEGDNRTVATLARLDAAAGSSARETLVDTEVLQPGRREFTHPLVRAVVLADMHAAERSSLHRRAAQMLAESGAPAESVALHLVMAEPAGERWATDALVGAAGDAASRGAPEAAATFLRRALDEGGPDLPQVAITRQLGMAEIASGAIAGVSRLREAARASDDPAERADILLDAGRALFSQGLFQEAEQALAEGLAESEAIAGEHADELRRSLLSISILDAAVLERIGGLRAVAAELAPRSRADPVLAATLAWVLSASERPAERGTAVARRAVEEEDPRAPPDPLVRAGALTALAAGGRLHEAKAGWDRVVAGGRRAGSLATLTFGLVLRAPVLLRLGDVRAAEADVREVLDFVVGADEPGERRDSAPWLLAPLVDTLIERDEVAEGSRLHEMSGVGEDLPELLQSNYLLESLGRLRLAEGRHGDAIRCLRECGRRQAKWGVENPGFSAWRSQLALALAAGRERAEALALCTEEMELAREFAVARELGMGLRARGLIEGGERGLESLREAVATLSESEAVLELARATVDLGAALRRAGRRTDARDPLRRGLDLARRGGGKRIAAFAHAELLATGAKPRRLAFSGLESLTASELRTARMATEGMSNREIAQALFVTEKTVEGHLGNAYRKLGISSRSQLAGALAEDPDARTRPGQR